MESETATDTTSRYNGCEWTQKKVQDKGVMCPHGKIHVEAALVGAAIDEAWG